MPSITRPQTVYWPLRLGAAANMMKNCESALLGFWARAMPTVPRTNGALENSAARSTPDPPVPLPFGSPVCAMKSSITRWNFRPS